MGKQLEYTFNKRGSTYGAETGGFRRFDEGQTIVAPEGEFRHLRPGTYETRPLKPKGPTIDATDAARELAAEHDLDLSQVEGSGDEGRILKGDVEALIAE